MSLNASSPNFNYKIHLGESNLTDYINKSLYEEMKQEQETNEILNNLRMKYLPNSSRSNSYNKSLNMTYLNKNNSFKLISSFTNLYNNMPKTTNNSFNKINSNKNYVTLREILPDNKKQKNFDNIEEQMILNKENINNENIDNNESKKENKYLNDYFKKENEYLKKMNNNYEIIISQLIEYINEINYFFGQNTLDLHDINNLIKTKNLNEDYTSVNNLKSRLKTMKINIIKFNTIKKSQTVPSQNFSDFNHDINFNKNKKVKNSEEKKINSEKYEYKPIIFDRKIENFDKITKSEDRGGIKRARTMFDRLPKTYWSLNKKVKFRESKKYNFK